MRKIIFVLIVFCLLFSGCDSSSPTGKSVVSEDKITECAKLCNDGSNTEEYFYNSCEKIFEYGGEETFNDYVNECRK